MSECLFLYTCPIAAIRIKSSWLIGCSISSQHHLRTTQKGAKIPQYEFRTALAADEQHSAISRKTQLAHEMYTKNWSPLHKCHSPSIVVWEKVAWSISVTHIVLVCSKCISIHDWDRQVVKMWDRSPPRGRPKCRHRYLSWTRDPCRLSALLADVYFSGYLNNQ